jgi:hypothetical protein
MYCDEFFREQSGKSAVEEWLNDLNPKERNNVLSKMQFLRDEGLRLVINETLRPIKNFKKKDRQDKNLYELICGSLRVGVYYDAERNTFIYIHSWRKKKQLQTEDIDHCRKIMHKYIAIKGSN